MNTILNVGIALMICCFLILTIGYFVQKERKDMVFFGGLMSLVVAFIFFMTLKTALYEVQKKRDDSVYKPVNTVLYQRVDSDTIIPKEVKYE